MFSFSKKTLFTGLILFIGCSKSSSTDDTQTVNIDFGNIETTERPGKRSEVIAIPDVTTNTIMIFGGNEGPIVDQMPYAEYTDETWIFEPGNGWTELELETQPSARGRFTVAYDEANNRAILFAGRWREAGTSGDYELFNDLWQFDFITHEWTLLDDGTSEDAPEGRYYPGAVWDPQSETFYSWGGNINADAMSIQPKRQLYSWTESDGWIKVETSGDKPSRRAFFDTTYDSKRNRLILFAGQVGDFISQAYNDLYALDLNTMKWEQLHDGTGGSYAAPSTRMHPQMNYDPVRDRYLCFGGHTDVGDMNDLWSFDPNTPDADWEMIYEADVFTDAGLGCLTNSRDVPADYVDMDLLAPERRHRGMHAIMYDQLWIFGGMHAECSDHLDDTWRYSLSEEMWFEVIEARTGESCARRDDACECLCF